MQSRENCERCKNVKVALERVYSQMIALEYILDSTNQKRKRKDTPLKRAWGYAFNVKGLIIKALGYYQPTLFQYHDKFRCRKVNPTWTRNAKRLFEICQNAKKVSLLSDKADMAEGEK